MTHRARDPFPSHDKTPETPANLPNLYFDAPASRAHVTQLQVSGQTPKLRGNA